MGTIGRSIGIGLLTLLGTGMALPAFSASLDDGLMARLAEKAPDLDPDVLATAFRSSRCAVSTGISMPERLAIIDFSLPSSEKRLWIFDLEAEQLVLNDLVAHGKNSGDFRSTSFSNNDGSFQSSIGLFQAHESYIGKHGYSLRLDGLEPGINDRARARAIVIHGADYVNENWVNKYGRIGRSHGCPAVDNRVIRQVVDNLKGGQLIFTYYPDQEWLHSSAFVNCDSRTTVAASAGKPDDQG